MRNFSYVLSSCLVCGTFLALNTVYAQADEMQYNVPKESKDYITEGGNSNSMQTNDTAIDQQETNSEQTSGTAVNQRQFKTTTHKKLNVVPVPASSLPDQTDTYMSYSRSTPVDDTAATEPESEVAPKMLNQDEPAVDENDSDTSTDVVGTQPRQVPIPDEQPAESDPQAQPEQSPVSDGSQPAEPETDNSQDTDVPEQAPSDDQSALDTQNVTSAESIFARSNAFYGANYNQTQIDNAKYIYNFFIQRGWTANAIAGLLGNMVFESSLYPDIWEVGGGGGYGLVQWTPADKFINWANSQGLDPTTLYAQCMRIDYEMRNKSAGQYYPTSQYPMTSLQYIQSTASPKVLAMVFLANYERPANPIQLQRGTQAEYWYNYLTGNSTSTDETDTVGEQGTYTFTVDTNIRLSPSLNGQIVGRYSKGQTVSYFKTTQADGYTWLGYYTASGRICYVAVVDGNVGTTTPEDTDFGDSENTETGTYTFSVDTNIRTSPSLNGTIVGRYLSGQSVRYYKKVTADGYTWLGYYTASGKTCYVADVTNSQPSEPDVEVPSGTDAVANGGTYTFSVDTNIRLSPSLNGKIVGRYAAGQSVNYSTTTQADGYTWLGYQTASGKTCYVARIDNNNDAPSQPAQAPAEPHNNDNMANSGTYTFSVDTNIRLSPNLQGQIVGRYAAGETVRYSSKTQADGYTWLGYQTASGKNCYVAVVNGAPTSNQTNVTPTSGTHTFSVNTNIRLSPSLNGEIVGQYGAGQTVNYNGTVVADGYTWLVYQTASGKTCYAAAL